MIAIQRSDQPREDLILRLSEQSFSYNKPLLHSKMAGYGITGVVRAYVAFLWEGLWPLPPKPRPRHRDAQILGYIFRALWVSAPSPLVRATPGNWYQLPPSEQQWHKFEHGFLQMPY